jgi:hypothetical protein
VENLSVEFDFTAVRVHRLLSHHETPQVARQEVLDGGLAALRIH